MPDFYLLIPCYNNAEGLIRSLLSVNYPDHLFSIIIVDDGSHEPITRERIVTAVNRQLSMTIIRLEKNSGITNALNTGLELLYREQKAGFIARLDCGDICAPERFYQQVGFLRSHQEIDLVGTWCRFKDYSSGVSYNYITPTAHKHILKSMYFRNVFIHPTVMWRHHRDNLVFYPKNFPHAEDYGLFNEILIKGSSAVIPHYLVTCELTSNGISLTHRQQQLKSRMSVVRSYGKNKWLSVLGVCKLLVLLFVPYNILFRIKKKLYNE